MTLNDLELAINRGSSDFCDFWLQRALQSVNCDEMDKAWAAPEEKGVRGSCPCALAPLVAP